MRWSSRQKQSAVFFAGLILLIVSAAWAARSHVLRPLYAAIVTEMRLAYRGNPLVRIRFSSRDGMNQVYIPAGEFTMGSNNGGNARSLQEHAVYLDAYWINQIEVTNAMYALCYEAGQCRHPAHYNSYFDDPAFADYPVDYINWYEAQAFCSWEGGRLATEAEWEKVARGPNEFRYPWGNAAPDNTLLNFDGYYAEPRPAYDYLTGISPYGVLNMAGNVQEWVADWYSPDYYSDSPHENPPGPPAGTLKVLRGGGFWDNATEVQTYYRFKHDPASSGQHRGIRCVRDAGE
jgi:formylglycine-generating enzyme required for sulfatase activity